MAGVLVYSFAGAALGGFDSPLGAVVGGWIIGVTEALAGTYIDVIGSDLKVLVPLGVIFVVLLVRPVRAVRLAGGEQGMSLVRVTAGSRAHVALRAGTALLVAIVVIAIPFNSNPSVNGNLTLVMSYAVAAMGLGLLVGYAGQISLGQGAFFAIGAYAAASMLAKTGLPYLLAVAAGRRGHVPDRACVRDPGDAAARALPGAGHARPRGRGRAGDQAGRADHRWRLRPRRCRSRRCRAGSRSTRTSGSTCSAWW